MGLMDVFGGKKSRVPAVTQVKARIKGGIEVPAGDYEGVIYVYDGRPLKKLHEGDTFQMTVLPGSLPMKSVYTGRNTDGDPDTCVSYKGQLVGYLSRGSHFVSQLVQRHGSATITVRHDGMNRRGWPEIVPTLPDHDWFLGELGIDGVPKNGPGMELYKFYDEQWKADLPDGRYSVEVRELPVPKGSKAKPSLQILLDGTVCAEVTSRNGRYKKLAPLAGRDGLTCQLGRHTIDSGKTRYMIAIKE